MTKKPETTADLRPDPRNVNKGTQRGNSLLKWSVNELGAGRSILVDSENQIIAGNKTVENSGNRKLIVVETTGDELVVVRRTDLTLGAAGPAGVRARQLALADNRISELNYDPDLEELLLHQADGISLMPLYDPDEIAAMLGDLQPKGDNLDGGGNGAGDPHKGALFENFLIPPFSVFDSRQGYWQDRKDAWLARGILPAEPDRDQANIMAGKNVVGKWDSSARPAGVTITDPVLVEIMLRWFCPPGGRVLDPFAGTSAPGIVASLSGFPFVGIELNEAQVRANWDQAAKVCGEPDTPNYPEWLRGDCRMVLKDSSEDFDFVFTSPPYGDLEKYSDDPADLSNQPYRDFISALADVAGLLYAALRPNRFAALIIGEFRDKRGRCHGFVADVIRIFTAAGFHYYNEAVLLTPLASLPVRVARSFPVSRKLGKAHQNVLIFCKGDPKKAVSDCGKVDVGPSLEQLAQTGENETAEE